MAWNEPGGGRNNDPWRGRDNNNRGSSELDEVIKKLQDRFGNVLGGGGGSGSSGGGYGMLLLVAGLLFALWVVAGFFRVEQAEEAVVLRFGKYHSTVNAGLHWQPWGIDTVMKVDVNQRNSMPVRATMLTEDQNIVDIDLQVQYVVSDSKAFFLENSNPVEALRNSVESALRHVVGGSEMDKVLTDGREAIAFEVHQRLQDYLNRYNTGLLVDKLNIEDAHPPKDVKAAFDDVIKAKEDEERVKNEAQAYANQIVPEARGEAQRMLEEANAYKTEVVERSKGQASRFDSLYTEYSMSPEVTRRRMYIETMEQIYSNTSKVMVDLDGGDSLMYLPIDKIIENQGQRSQQSQSSSTRTDASSTQANRSASATPVRGLDRIRQARQNRWEDR